MHFLVGLVLLLALLAAPAVVVRAEGQHVAACVSSSIPVIYEHDQLRTVDLALPVHDGYYVVHFVPLRTETYLFSTGGGGGGNNGPDAAAVHISQGGFCDEVSNDPKVDLFAPTEEDPQLSVVELKADMWYTLRISTEASTVVVWKAGVNGAPSGGVHWWWGPAVGDAVFTRVILVHNVAVAVWCVVISLLLVGELSGSARLIALLQRLYQAFGGGGDDGEDSITIDKQFVWTTINYLLCLVVFATTWLVPVYKSLPCLLCLLVLVEITVREMGWFPNVAAAKLNNNNNKSCWGWSSWLSSVFLGALLGSALFAVWTVFVQAGSAAAATTPLPALPSSSAAFFPVVQIACKTPSCERLLWTVEMYYYVSVVAQVVLVPTYWRYSTLVAVTEEEEEEEEEDNEPTNLLKEGLLTKQKKADKHPLDNVI